MQGQSQYARLTTLYSITRKKIHPAQLKQEKKERKKEIQIDVLCTKDA